jgi:hypothetical protein
VLAVTTTPRGGRFTRVMTRLEESTYLFGRTEGTTAALFRVTFGVFATWQAVGVLLNVDRYFGPHALVPPDPARFSALSAVMWAYDSSAWVHGLAWFFLAVATLFTLGVWPRLTLALVAYLHISFQHRNPLILNAGDRLFAIVAVLALFLPLGARLALASRQRSGTVFGQRAIELQIRLVYLMTAIAKLMEQPWQDGTALYHVLASPVLAEWPIEVESRALIAIMTYGTLAFELAFALLVGWRPARRPLLLAGVVFHLGIEITMRIPTFSFLMMISYLAFLTDAEARWLLSLGGRAPWAERVAGAG